MSKKIIHTTGSRKTAVARATLTAGTGIVKINNKALELVTPRISRMRIQEPLLLAGEDAKGLDIRVKVIGGGPAGQADAIRIAIARGLVEHKAELKERFLNYDRQLLVADVRRKEDAKPNRHGQARAKVQKSYR